ncbi:PREDICTED: suppressor of Mek1-like isoform X1 [Brassica oleracea var. oleracea]|uniref:suppressor of Mek1-like isoform X1 n=1 Tax=Brassica oleracea var. oleracea TaxID=109376 RepID=UPI0006A74183|nr:PREDICTED: suppressor of Mek1-like isoform X1 [Brassica oleracea var. oleracea]
MDFHSLLRRDLQFLCKRNKIPANMTNLAMADALKSLEIVEGLDEYMNQNDANVLQSPASVAKLPPSTAARTTRRKTAMKAEPQSSSQLVVVNRSCRLKSKSLHGEMEQENVDEESKTSNVKIEVSVAKTPAARSTRKASAAASCKSKVQESKKGELVQSAYSTRRSTRLLEKCMADLSLMTKETEQKVAAQEKNPDGSEERSEEAEVIPGRDLSASMEKEWENSDQVTGGLEISVGNTETMEVMTDEKAESEKNLVQEDKQEETLQANEAICEEGSKKNDNDQEIIDLGEIPVLEHASTETNNDNKELKDIQALEPEKVNIFHEETVVDQPDGDSETEPEEEDSGVDSDSTISEADSSQVGHQETEKEIQGNDSETVKINFFDEAAMVDQTESEEDDSGVDSDDTISEADSNRAVQGSDIAEEEMILSESEGSVTAPTSPSLLLEEAEVKTAPLSPFAAESISAQFPRPNKSAATTPSKNSAVKLVSVDNNNKENNMEMMVSVSDNGEINAEAKKQKKKVEFDEENLKDVSIRKLVKMVRELSINGSNNRTALQMLPGNNQIAE